MSSKIIHAAIALGACASLFSATDAFADPPFCNAIQQLSSSKDGTYTGNAAPPVVYVTGSSALKPIIAALAPSIFSASSPQRPATIVYLSQGSCVGVSSIAQGVALPATDYSNPAAPKNLASYWDPNSTRVVDGTHTLKEENCQIPTSTTVDIGASDVFAESCGLSIASLPSVADFQGPIQSMTFAVNASSAQHTISAEAAYLTFGFHTAAPWTTGSHIFRRNSTSGTQAMIATAIGLPGNAWTGIDGKSSDGVFAALTTGLSSQADFDNSIGILSADYGAKTGVRILGYQHTGQRCAFTPDIQNGDKANTREGRYAIWGPIHLFTKIDTSTGLASNLNARDFIAYLLGTQAPPAGIDLIRLSQQLDVVPPCAMKVQRKAEMGAITPFVPTRSCNCAYDQAAGLSSAANTCKACTSNSDCTGTQSCNFNFCE